MPLTLACCYAGRRNAASAFCSLIGSGFGIRNADEQQNIFLYIGFSNGFCSDRTFSKFRHKHQALLVGCKAVTTISDVKMTIRIMPRKICFCLLVLQALLSCFGSNTSGQSSANEKSDGIMPFEAVITNADYSMAYSLKTILTHREVKIIFRSDLAGEKDSVLFSKLLPTSDTLRQISAISLHNLKPHYSNNCINDGSQVTVTLKKESTIKTIHLNNYYQEDVGKIIYLVNSLVPDRYKICYDKAGLIAAYKRCNGN